VPVKAAYDVEHERPWGWQVPVYFWTKAVSTGVLAVPAVAIAAGWLEASKTLNLLPALVALVLMGITVALLISDLARRERFVDVLRRPQGNSWIARGAYLLVAYTVLCALYGLVELIGLAGLSAVLRWLAVAGGGLAAIYTAFLFGNAKAATSGKRRCCRCICWCKAGWPVRPCWHFLPRCWAIRPRRSESRLGLWPADWHSTCLRSSVSFSCRTRRIARDTRRAW